VINRDRNPALPSHCFGEAEDPVATRIEVEIALRQAPARRTEKDNWPLCYQTRWRQDERDRNPEASDAIGETLLDQKAFLKPVDCTGGVYR
jgi:hypothetical protein